MQNILQVATTIVGTMMSLAYFPQAYQMYKNKSGFNISIPTFLLFGIGTLLWTIYGITIGDYVLIISFFPGVVGSWLIVFLTIKYKKSSDTAHTIEDHRNWFKKNPTDTQNILLLLTLVAAILLGVQQNQINSRIQQINDYVGVKILPTLNSIEVVNVGKLNLYIYGISNSADKNPLYYYRPRFLSIGTLSTDPAYYIINDYAVPKDYEGEFTLSLYLKDEYGVNYVTECGGLIRKSIVENKIKYSMNLWTYKTYKKDWEKSAPTEFRDKWSQN